jgi:ATP-dependent Lon protease
VSAPPPRRRRASIAQQSEERDGARTRDDTIAQERAAADDAAGSQADSKQARRGDSQRKAGAQQRQRETPQPAETQPRGEAQQPQGDTPRRSQTQQQQDDSQQPSNTQQEPTGETQRRSESETELQRGETQQRSESETDLPQGETVDRQGETPSEGPSRSGDQDASRGTGGEPQVEQTPIGPPPVVVPVLGGTTPDVELPPNLAILPTRDGVLYPGMLLPMQASEQPWVRLLSDAVSARQPVGIVLQRDNSAELTSYASLHNVGTAANIVRLLKLPDGSLQVLLQGATRIRLAQTPSQTDPYLRADVESLPSSSTTPSDIRTAGLVKNLQTLFQRVVSLSPVLPDEMGIAAANVDDPGRLADFVAANIDLDPPQRQEILQELDPLARAHRVTEFVTRELEVLEIGSKIQSQIRESMEKTQRDFYLRQQLEAIRRELGESDEGEAALRDLRERLGNALLPPETRAEADRELSRLASIPTASPEHSMVRTYLEWLADLPWSVTTQDNLDLHHAKDVLDEDHFDLTRVKDRILEYLAVMKLRAERDAAAAERDSDATGESQTVPGDTVVEAGTPAVKAPVASASSDNGPRVASVRGPILCLVGPPGVGKTSLGQSIARALGRKFVHMSLGGVRDEAEIRGHRRTYIGALPGRIIQALRRAGSRNPVFILDELDKLGNDWRGDPSSALLEVLDPAQNADFRDHYLDVPFDLSSVLFIATANVMDTVPPALRDRLEVIDIPGYTEDDKVQIARRYLVPRQLTENGLEPNQVRISDSALRRIVREYTREAGVRNLEREIATVARKTARAIVMGEAASVTVSNRTITDMLGPPRVQLEVATREDEVGVATGLAYTPTGGEVLFIEARAVPGKGNLLLTGQLGDVMKESAQAALTYARARGRALGLGADDPLEGKDIHVHVPAGAVPKDGPSAGITMATSIISALTRRPVDHTVAMTGEITLRGRVLPIGGLKEKVLAAHRAGITHVIAPRDNRRDVEEIPARVRKEVTFTFVDHMDQVLNAALKREVQPERADVKPLRRGNRRSADGVAAAARTQNRKAST